MGTKRPWWLLFDGYFHGSYSTKEKAEQQIEKLLQEWPYNDWPGAREKFFIWGPPKNGGN
jgi:hypothetical protein